MVELMLLYSYEEGVVVTRLGVNWSRQRFAKREPECWADLVMLADFNELHLGLPARSRVELAPETTAQRALRIALAAGFIDNGDGTLTIPKPPPFELLRRTPHG